MAITCYVANWIIMLLRIEIMLYFHFYNLVS